MVDLRGVEGEVEPLGIVVGVSGDHLDVDDRQVAVGDDRISTAVAGVVAGREVLDVVDGDLRVRLGDGLDDVVALDVRVLFDLVGDLQGEEGEPDALVVRSRRQPVRLQTAGQQPPRGHFQKRT